jgi:nucleotide-binding universal stress UspA family protein
MNTESAMLLTFLAWVSFGPVLAVVMGRRGHSPWTWGLLGIFLGPLAVPSAIDAHRRRRQAILAARSVAAGPGRPGPLSVLVGIDGSDEARVALSRALDLLGDRIGRLSLVTVIDYDTAEDPWRFADAEASARQWMAAARAAASNIDSEEYIVVGEPARALIRIASERGYQLLVAGSRGRGLSPYLLGSVAQSLAATSPVPVLIGGQGRHGTPPVQPHEPGESARTSAST